MDMTFDWGKSQVPKSPAFKDIMAKYDVIGRDISMSKFHRDYVQPLDKKISLRQWSYFITNFTDYTQEKIRKSAERALKVSQDVAVSESNLETRSLKKILAIADITLDEIMENPEQLKKISISERMTWFMNAMKARDSRAQVNLKQVSEKRKTSIYEDMMAGAQYGAIDSDVIEDPATPPPKQIEEKKPAIEIPIKKEVKEFSPEDIE